MTDIKAMEETQEVQAASGGAEELISDLTRAWQEQEDATSINGAVMRTSTLNLIIFSADAQAARDAEAVMPQLTEVHPCRAVHIEALPAADAPLRATSHMHTKVENGVRVITCEQVCLEAGSEALETLEGVIAPLLHPDLPVVLWWRGNPPFEGRLFAHLVQAADRVIYDSDWFLESEEDLPWAVDLIDSNAQFDVAFTDVNWSRLTPWRALIAQFFDGAQNVHALDGVEALTIEYADAKITPNRVATKAWLLLGWLASRLRWSGRRATPPGGSPSFTVKAPQGDVAVTFKRIDDDGPDTLRSVELRSRSPKPGTYRVELLVGQGCARTVTSIDGLPPLERVVSGELETYAELIANELDMPGRDRVYEEALRFAAAVQAPHDQVSSPS